MRLQSLLPPPLYQRQLLRPSLMLHQQLRAMGNMPTTASTLLLRAVTESTQTTESTEQRTSERQRPALTAMASTPITVCLTSTFFDATKLTCTGKYPPPKGGYGKYADYGKYGAKDKREAEASPDGYGKYANYGKPAYMNLAFSHAHTTKAITLLPRVAMESTPTMANTEPRTSVRPNLRPSPRPTLTATANTPTTASTPPPKGGYGSYGTYKREAAPEAEPEANPDGYGKYADYGKYPPPAGGYGKYANYGKYGAKEKREAEPEAEPEANPDGYGKYANYGKYPPPAGGYGKYANYGKYGQ